jgi:hypothetical protein
MKQPIRNAMAGLDHSKMADMRHGASGAGTYDMAAMEHSAMPGMAHGSTTGTRETSSMSAMPGMQHGSSTAAPIVVEPPVSNAAIAQTQPAATLRPDELDAPAPTAVQEAAKATSGVSHSMEAPPKAPPPPQHHHPQPQPPSEYHHHSGGEAS